MSNSRLLPFADIANFKRLYIDIPSLWPEFSRGVFLRMNNSVDFNQSASKFENNASKPKKNAPRRKGAFFFLWIKYKFFGNPYK